MNDVKAILFHVSNGVQQTHFRKLCKFEVPNGACFKKQTVQFGFAEPMRSPLKNVSHIVVTLFFSKKQKSYDN